MAYKVYTTDTFEKKIEKLQNDEKERLTRLYLQLKDNPFVGDQVRYSFFREKRIKEKRIYYLIYEDLNIVLLVAVSGKKDQQKTIDYIVRYFNEFRRFAEELSGD